MKSYLVRKFNSSGCEISDPETGDILEMSDEYLSPGDTIKIIKED